MNIEELKLPVWALERIGEIANEMGITREEVVTQVLAFGINNKIGENKFDDKKYWDYILKKYNVIELREFGMSIRALVVHLNENGIKCNEKLLGNALSEVRRKI